MVSATASRCGDQWVAAVLRWPRIQRAPIPLLFGAHGALWRLHRTAASIAFAAAPSGWSTPARLLLPPVAARAPGTAAALVHASCSYACKPGTEHL